MASSIVTPGILYLWLMQRKQQLASQRATESLPTGSATMDSASAETSPSTSPRSDSAGCIRYVGGGQPEEPRRFFNLRTESAWHLHDRLNPDRHTDDRFPLTSRQPPFHIPARAWWALMRQDLAALTYELVGERQVKLIKKEDLMETLGRSPDRGDALIQSFSWDRTT